MIPTPKALNSLRVQLWHRISGPCDLVGAHRNFDSILKAIHGFVGISFVCFSTLCSVSAVRTSPNLGYTCYSYWQGFFGTCFGVRGSVFPRLGVFEVVWLKLWGTNFNVEHKSFQQ